jgi:hypothetical protein
MVIELYLSLSLSLSDCLVYPNYYKYYITLTFYKRLYTKMCFFCFVFYFLSYSNKKIECKQNSCITRLKNGYNK